MLFAVYGSQPHFCYSCAASGTHMWQWILQHDSWSSCEERDSYFTNVSCCFKRKCLWAHKCGRCCLNWFTPDIYSQVFDFWTFCTSCQQILICLTQKIWRKKCHWVSYLLQTVVILWRNAFKGKITHIKWANIYHFGLSVFIYYIVLCFCCLIESLLGHLRESIKRSH